MTIEEEKLSETEVCQKPLTTEVIGQLAEEVATITPLHLWGWVDFSALCFERGGKIFFRSNVPVEDIFKVIESGIRNAAKEVLQLHALEMGHVKEPNFEQLKLIAQLQKKTNSVNNFKLDIPLPEIHPEKVQEDEAEQKDVSGDKWLKSIFNPPLKAFSTEVLELAIAEKMSELEKQNLTCNIRHVEYNHAAPISTRLALDVIRPIT